MKFTNNVKNKIFFGNGNINNQTIIVSIIKEQEKKNKKWNNCLFYKSMGSEAIALKLFFFHCLIKIIMIGKIENTNEWVNECSVIKYTLKKNENKKN